MTAGNDNAPDFRVLRVQADWITRPLFGILLALFALVVVAMGAGWLAAVLALVTLAAAHEWHRCVGGGQADRAEWIVTAATVALALALLLYSGRIWAGLLAALAGSAVAYVLARSRDKNPLWQAFGALYLAVPCVSLVALRAFPPHAAAYIVIGLLLIVWATDTGALICGKLIGGPRLAPRLSPGKTWAGTLGGSATAALVFALYIAFLGGSAWLSALFAFVFSAAAHGGDLFESFVKRRFGLKDSGAAIPGHGGLLDRMDSTLAAAPAMALLVFAAHLNPLFGVSA